MEKRLNNIMVTWDFTKKAEYAFLHAIEFSKSIKVDIELLHLVDDEKDIEKFEKKLKEDIERLFQTHGLRPNGIVRRGRIFKSIKKIAEERNSLMIIMGTHGIKGMQKILGSWALKVIADSVIPFVTVQVPPEPGTKESIVLPITERTENKEILAWVKHISLWYKIRVHLMLPITSSTWSRTRINTNMIFTKHFLKANNINYEVVKMDGNVEFSQEIINYSTKINAGLILVILKRGLGIQDYMLGTNEQSIIANSKKIPVMCMNPNKKLTRIGSFN